MGTVVARKAVTSVGRGRPVAARPSSLRLTLADLITAIQDVVGPEDDGLVVATVRHLLHSGRLTRRGTGTYQCPPQRQESGSRTWQLEGSDTRARGYAGGAAAGV
jgi:hypothetical protein